jgi:hypothetical protein
MPRDPGDIYTGEEAFGVPGKLDGDDVSYANVVNKPGVLSKDNKGALDVDATKTDGVGMKIYSNHGAGADTNLAAVWADSPDFDADVFRVINDGTKRAVKIEQRNTEPGTEGALQIVVDATAGKVYSIRIDDPNPDIEFVETDQTPPAGQFEIAVQADQFQINGRNAADTSFETILKFERVADGARIIFPNGVQFQVTAVAGVLGALPATPEKYLKITDDGGTDLVIPCYKAS